MQRLSITDIYTIVRGVLRLVESDFGDDMALVPSMKSHTGGQGLGAASAPATAVPLKKVAPHRPHAADVLLAERMRIVRQ